MEKDSVDERLACALAQGGLPIVSEPFEEIGKKLGMSGEEALRRARTLAGFGVIKKLGPDLNHDKLGCITAIAAGRAPKGAANEAARLICKHPEVALCRITDKEPNIWLVLRARSQDDLSAAMLRISRETGVRLGRLRTKKDFITLSSRR